MLTLYYYEGLTLAEIGNVLGVTESRVCQIHTKAIFQLRSRLSRTAPRTRPRHVTTDRWDRLRRRDDANRPNSRLVHGRGST